MEQKYSYTIAIIAICCMPITLGCRPSKIGTTSPDQTNFDLARATITADTHPVVILGGGISGLNAAVRLAMVNYKPLVVTGPLPGGLLTQSDSVRNWPGEIDIPGQQLTDKLRAQAQHAGASFVAGKATAVDFSQWPYLITIEEAGCKKQVAALSVIIAMGTTPNYLGIPGEQTYWGKGVSNCAVCDGDLYRDQEIAIVGGGDGAISEAAYLAKLAKKVHLIVRRDALRAQDKRKDEVLAKENVHILYNTNVTAVQGSDEGVTHVTVVNNKTKKQSQLPVQALFLAIGAKPNSTIFKGQLALDDHGYIQVDHQPSRDMAQTCRAQKTSRPGVYAVGDIADPHFKQADAAAGDGCKAALQTNEFLEYLGFDPKKFEQQKQQQPRISKQPATQPSTKEVAAPVAPAITAEIVNASSESQISQLRNAGGKITIVDFYADWCGPCRGMMPTLKKIATDYAGKVRVVKVNIDKVPSVKRSYSLRGIPRLLFYDQSGKKIHDKTGAMSYNEFKKLLDKYI